jgi:hypothetical protein
VFAPGITFIAAIQVVAISKAELRGPPQPWPWWSRSMSPWSGCRCSRCATVRTLVFPLSFLLCGPGFTGIFLQRNRRALHGMTAGTAVVYAWDARAARLRFLDRDAPQNPR